MASSPFQRAILEFTFPIQGVLVRDVDGAGVASQFLVKEGTMGEVAFFEILGEAFTRGTMTSWYSGQATVYFRELVGRRSIRAPIEVNTSIQYDPHQGQVFCVQIRIAEQTRGSRFFRHNNRTFWVLVATEGSWVTVIFPIAHRNEILDSLQNITPRVLRSPAELMAMQGLINLRTTNR